jgi:hypothetical protein
MNKETNNKPYQRNQPVTFEVDIFDTDTLHNKPTKFIGIIDEVMYEQYIRFKYLYKYEEESLCLYDGLWDTTKLNYTRPSSVVEFDWLLGALRNDNLHYCTARNTIFTEHDVEDMFDYVIKSGDYITITTDENSKWTCIFNETLDDLPNEIRLILCYVTSDVSDDMSYTKSLLSLKTREDGTACLAILDAVRSVRFATEDEIERLDEMISKHGLKFDKSENRLISTEAEPAETEDAFDWTSLKPFTPVLVRTSKYNYNCKGEWVPDLFYKMKITDENVEFYTISTRNLSVYDECVPYNDETKHLIDSNDDAPSKYTISLRDGKSLKELLNKYSENVKFCDKSIILY